MMLCNKYSGKKIIELDIHTKKLLESLGNGNLSADEFCQNINQFASFLGKELSIKNLKELDDAMLCNKPLVI